MAVRLDDKLIRTLAAPETGSRITYDDEVKGFGLRVTAGAKAFILRYRVAGRERLITIGSFPEWDTKQARDRAKALKRQVDEGKDPMGERHAERAAPTMADLCDRYEKEHLIKRRPSTQRLYASIIARCIRPELGKLKVSAVKHADLEKLHRQIAETAPYMANRSMALISRLLNLAIKWELRPDNPAKGLERKPEHKREHYLTPSQIARLGEVLAKHPERASARAVQLLLLTGARRGEVLGAKWQQFDLAQGVWTKPAATTKQAKLHRVPLSAPALSLLKQMKTEADAENVRRVRDGYPPIQYLFPGKPGTHLVEIKRFWASVAKAAGIEGTRPCGQT